MAKRGLIGPIMQQPPMYSAVSIKGERLYKAARRGQLAWMIHPTLTHSPSHHQPQLELASRNVINMYNAHDLFGHHAPQHVDLHAAFKFLETSFRVRMFWGAGEEVERPARPVTVHSFDLQRSAASTEDLDFRISCSKGTYIRSLAHDLVRHPLHETLFGAHKGISWAPEALLGTHQFNFCNSCSRSNLTSSHSVADQSGTDREESCRGSH